MADVTSARQGPTKTLMLRVTRKIALRVPIDRFPKNCSSRAPVRGRPRLLVLGVYMALKPNYAAHLVKEFSSTDAVAVEQRWVCMMGQPPSEQVAAVTTRRLDHNTPKWPLVNELITPEDLDQFDYFMICDDDILIKPGFVDSFIAEQQSLDFALAQPARTWRSITDHDIVRRRLFTRARQTNFVEIGPVVSFRRDFLKAVYPFSSESPMGWGYDLTWPIVARELGLAIGIIDRTPVDHSLRHPGALYDSGEHYDLMMSYLSKRPHVSWAEAARTVRVFR